MKTNNDPARKARCHFSKSTIFTNSQTAISSSSPFSITYAHIFSLSFSLSSTLSLYLQFTQTIVFGIMSTNVKIPSLWFCFLFFTDEHMAARVVSSITSSASKKRLPGKLTRSQSLAFNCPSLLFK